MGYLRVTRGMDEVRSYIAPGALEKGIAVQEKSSNAQHIDTQQ